MSKFVAVCLCVILAVGVLVAALLLRPARVLAASGILTVETPLHDAPTPDATVITLLPEGAVVVIDGPPVDGFYPVSSGDLTGWMRGETLLLEKDEVVTDTGGIVAPEAVGDGVLADDAALDPPVDAAPDSESSATAASAPMETTSPASGDVSVTGEPVAGAELSTPEPPPAADVPPDSSAAAISEPAALAPDPALSPAPAANEPPLAVPGAGPSGPASVTAETPILLGPGAHYGLIATAPAGSAVEQTGHLVDGYVTVRFAGITGWAPLDLLGPPTTPPAASAAEGSAKEVDTTPA